MLGGLSLATREAALRGGISGASIVPGDPGQSPLYTRMALPVGTPGAMPPGGQRPSERELTSVHTWILDGAAWAGPLRHGARTTTTTSDAAETALVRRIRARILAQSISPSEDRFEAYDQGVPDSNVSLRMVPIPGGEFRLGTPSDEVGRGEDEGPRQLVRVDAFWIGAHEVTWDAFRRFMLREAEGYQDPDTVAAAVSSPTPPYVEMSFGMGITGYPAISMTQHAASKYAQWLSVKTGRFYRLPTEAEWEYACRAGSETAYAFGNDPSALAEHGWFWDNSNGQYRPVGTKRPNAWGLFDMHGNVWEWTLDGYEASYGQSSAVLVNPWVRAVELYPRVVRGGSWMDDAPALRCGARRASDESWKMQDPQLPKSVWYHTDAQWLGFRLVRPTILPSLERMHAYWNSASGTK